MRNAIPFAVAAVVCWVWLWSDSNAGSQQNAAGNDGLKQLLRERLALTEKAHDLAVAGFRSGDANFSFAVVQDAKVKLLEARLDLAEAKDQRIKIHEEMVKDAAEYERVVSQMVKVGVGSPRIELNARIYHLERQIALARAK